METLMNLTIAEIVGGTTGIVVILSIIIEAIPVKINPVSTFLRWLGKKINVDVVDKVNALEKQVGEVEKKVNDIEGAAAEQSAISCRVRILRYADEMRLGVRHSKESFDQVLSDIDNYKRYCADHKDFKNSKTVAATQIILSTYSQCMDNNDFL